jgi:hypothetical protein
MRAPALAKLGATLADRAASQYGYHAVPSQERSALALLAARSLLCVYPQLALNLLMNADSS